MAYQPYQAPFMAYNPAVNPVPSAAYPSPNYQQMVYEPPKYAQPQSAGGNGIVWVRGEAAAKAHFAALNTPAMVMDSESQRFYLNSIDSAGMPAMRIFEYNEVFPNVQTTAPGSVNPDDKYVTREEYNTLKMQFDSFRAGSAVPDAESAAKPTKSKPKGGAGDE